MSLSVELRIRKDEILEYYSIDCILRGLEFYRESYYPEGGSYLEIGLNGKIIGFPYEIQFLRVWGYESDINVRISADSLESAEKICSNIRYFIDMLPEYVACL